MGDHLDASTISMLHGANAVYLEGVLERFLADPASVDPAWRAFFEGPGRALAQGPAPVTGPGFDRASIFAARAPGGAASESSELESTNRSFGRIFQLINAYRVRGHLKARLDPLGFQKTLEHPELDPFYWGFDNADFERLYSTKFLKGPQTMRLRDLMVYLNETYARTIGVEFINPDGYVVPFELAAVLLTWALVAAVYIARRKQTDLTPERLSEEGEA